MIGHVRPMGPPMNMVFLPPLRDLADEVIDANYMAIGELKR